MNICYVCERKEVENLLDCGLQPICSRFLKSATEEEYRHPLRLGQCRVCGLVQVVSPIPAAELKPIYDWVTYTEPQGHISELVDMMIDLPGLTKESSICGISFKDDSTLDLMKERGFKNVWRIDLRSDLKIDDSKAGLETVQAQFSPPIVSKIVEKHGRADIVIARHCLEHSDSPVKFMKALRQLVKPQGYVVFEVPDCQWAIEKHDYTTIWEEHILYFTPYTFKQCFSFLGFSLIRFENFSYPLENSLVGIGRLEQEAVPFSPIDNILENEKRRMLAYSKGLSKKRAEFKSFFADYQQHKGKIAILGAGHLTCAFINLLKVKDFIEFIVDDSPQKQDLFMPGSRIPIYESSSLRKKNIKLCLLGLAPDKEGKVIQNNKDFFENGGSFFSIFPGSKRFLDISK